MVKITKNMLKSVVKECLVEILTEGFGTNVEQLIERKQASRPQLKKKDSLFDRMDRSFAQNKPAGGFNRAVAAATQVATSDPILQGILADTAKTTLQEQLRHEPRTPTSQGIPGYDLLNENVLSAGADPGIDISSIFGDVANNWSEVLERSGAKKLP